MSRGSSSSSSRGSSSSSSRGSSRSSWSSSRGSSRSWGSSNHTTVIIGGSGGHYSGKANPIAWIVILFLIGLMSFTFGVSLASDSNQYGKVYAECVDNDYIGGWYYTTYEYTVNGKEYESRSEEGWEFPETEGKTVEIFYLKDNPNIITEKEPSGSGVGAVLIVVGLICIGVGVLIIVHQVKKKKKAKAEQTTDSQSTTDTEPTILDETTKQEEQFVRCSYCGSKYDKTATSCPKCGASRM
ncbi:MAG: hypothetical protein IKM43_03940 [Clostridia bacterium]|nr:hypothetical protein [Clostridia bacterium]